MAATADMAEIVPERTAVTIAVAIWSEVISAPFRPRLALFR